MDFHEKPRNPVDGEWLYHPEGRTAWAIAPGLAGVVGMISMLMLGALITHFVRMTRGVLLKGEGAAAVTGEMVPMALFALLAAALALAAYRRRLD